MKIDPIILYGLHFHSGVAEYRPKGQDMYRVLVSADTCRKMDPTFPGRPVYVGHVDEINWDKADGYIVESFFNQADGFHWCKFVLTTMEGMNAYKRGMKLSNAYRPTANAPGGTYQGIDYKSEITDAEYDHMALVPDPRYTQSIILTPEEFKAYNHEKEIELEKLANSIETENKGESSMLNFFKREKVQNASDLENTVVELPISKKQISIADLVKNADEMEKKDCYANGEHKVKVGEEEMSVNALIEKYNGMCKKNSEYEEEKKKNSELSEEEKKKNAEKAEEEKKANEAKAEEEKKANEAKAAEEKKEETKKNQLANYEKLKNAREREFSDAAPVMTLQEQVELGRKRYGSL